MALTSKSQTGQSVAGSALRATMRLRLLNLSLLNFSEKEEVERTLNQFDLLSFSLRSVWVAMPAFQIGMPRSWGRHVIEGDTREKRSLCGISMKSFLDDTLINLQERCILHGILMAGENVHH